MADIAKFVEEIKSMTVLELNELVKAIEEEFGVSAAAPVMVAGAGAADASGGGGYGAGAGFSGGLCAHQRQRERRNLYIFDFRRCAVGGLARGFDG